METKNSLKVLWEHKLTLVSALRNHNIPDVLKYLQILTAFITV